MSFQHSRLGANQVRVVVWTTVALIVAAFAVFLITDTNRAGPVRIALVTADSDPFWDVVAEGAQAAADQYDVELAIYKADGNVETQTREMLDATASSPDGIAISPVDPSQQALMLRQIAAERPLVTLDSDSVLSKRLCFIGADNYTAGRRCGELIKQALPNGGKVVVTMGPMKKENGHDRRQGIIDELMGLSFGPGRPTYPLDETYGDGSYELVATYIDEIDPEEAKANVLRALEEHPDVDCVVGIYAYGVPSALAALDEAGRDNVAVVGFDDAEATLAAIEDGRAFGTVAQDQYSYGYESVSMLARAARGAGLAVVPISEKLHIEPQIVTQDTLAEFRANRAQQRSGEAAGRDAAASEPEAASSAG